MFFAASARFFVHKGIGMPKRRYGRREPTHNWQEIRPLLKDSAQISYEILRPVLLWGQTPKERGAETSMSPRTIYYRANLFDQERAPLVSCTSAGVT